MPLPHFPVFSLCIVFHAQITSSMRAARLSRCTTCVRATSSAQHWTVETVCMRCSTPVYYLLLLSCRRDPWFTTPIHSSLIHSSLIHSSLTHSSLTHSSLTRIHSCFTAIALRTQFLLFFPCFMFTVTDFLPLCMYISLSAHQRNTFCCYSQTSSGKTHT